MLSDYFEQNEQKIKEALQNSEYPKTAKVLFSYYQKSKNIHDAILNIDYDLNFYPCLILFRCQIEHFIVATYIWIQFRIKENDDIARIYLEDYLIYEIIKKINYSKSNGIIMSSRIAIAFKKVLDILTDKKIITQREFEKLNIKANQFDIRKISKFFDENLPLKNDNIVNAKNIKAYLEYYNYFSTFVHGGPTADALMTNEYKNDFKKQAGEFIEKNSYIVGMQRLYVLYFLGMFNEKFVIDMRDELDKLIKTGV